MNDQLERLWQLQVLEQKKAALLAKAKTLPLDEQGGLWPEIRLLGQQVAASKEKLKSCKQECGRKELELETVTDQLQLLEATLYNGKIKNRKELEQIKQKSETLKSRIENMENEVFRCMEDCEELADRISAAEQQLRQKKQLHLDKQREASELSVQMQDEIAGIGRQCEVLAEEISAEMLQRYRELGRRIPYPVARLANGICGGCRMGIPSSLLHAGKARKEFLYCDNCGRLLIIDETL